MEAKHKEELRILRENLEAKSHELEEERLLREKDTGDLRNVHAEVEQLRKEKADLVAENDALRQKVADLEMEKGDKQEEDATPLDGLLKKLEKQCQKFVSDITIPHLGSARESSLLYTLVDINKELGRKMSGLRESRDLKEQLNALATLILEHRKWEFSKIRELGHDLTKLLGLEIMVENSDTRVRSRTALVMVGADIRLRGFEQSKTVIFKTPRENLQQEVIEAGNVAAHQAHVAADVALFNLGSFENKENAENHSRKVYYL